MSILENQTMTSAELAAREYIAASYKITLADELIGLVRRVQGSNNRQVARDYLAATRHLRELPGLDWVLGPDGLNILSEIQ